MKRRIDLLSAANLAVAAWIASVILVLALIGVTLVALVTSED